MAHRQQAPGIAFEFTNAGTLTPDGAHDLIQQVTNIVRGTPDGTTFLLHMDEEGTLHPTLVFPAGTPRQKAADTAVALAVALSSKAIEVPAPALQTLGVATLEVERDPLLSGEQAVTTAGTDVRVVAEQLSTMLHEGEWVAMVVRSPSRRESRNYSRWIQFHELAARLHQSTLQGRKVVSVWAGADSQLRARDVAENVLLLGNNLGTRAVSPSRSAVVAPWGMVAVLAAACAVALLVMPQWLATVQELVEVPLSWVVPALVAVAVVAVLGALMLWTGVVPTRWHEIRQLAQVGRMPAPPASGLWWSWNRPRRATVRTVRRGNEVEVQDVPERRGTYPLTRWGLMASAMIPASIMPALASSRYASGVSVRSAPAVVRAPVGPAMAVDEGGLTFLSGADLYTGVFVTGLPGSGKSYLLQSMVGWLCALRSPTTPLPRPEGVPQQIGMVAFDTKGDGEATRKYATWAAKFQVPVRMVEVAQHGGVGGVDLFPVPTDPGMVGAGFHEWATEVVSALMYAYGEEAIGNRSRPSLVAAFAAGAAVHVLGAEILRDRDGNPVAELPAGQSPFWYANILIGNRTPQLAVSLAELLFAAVELRSVVTVPWQAQLEVVRQLLEPLYGPGTTEAARRNLFDAPRSKIQPLLELEHYWTQPGCVSWEAALSGHEMVLVNFGIPFAPGAVMVQMADATREKASQLVMYSLWKVIQRVCVGWRSVGRQVVVVADEVKHIAERSSEILEWLRNDGRAFGCAMLFATQFPDQLGERLRKTMLGFGTVVAYAQLDATVVRQLVELLSVDGSNWSGAEIANLPKWTVVVKTTVDGQARRAFIGRVPSLEQLGAQDVVAVLRGSVSPDAVAVHAATSTVTAPGGPGGGPVVSGLLSRARAGRRQ